MWPMRHKTIPDTLSYPYARIPRDTLTANRNRFWSERAPEDPGRIRKTRLVQVCPFTTSADESHPCRAREGRTR